MQMEEKYKKNKRNTSKKALRNEQLLDSQIKMLTKANSSNLSKVEKERKCGPVYMIGECD